MSKHALALAALALLATGCATKRYPMATPLSGAEITLMTCRELMLEGVKTDELQKQIASGIRAAKRAEKARAAAQEQAA